MQFDLGVTRNGLIDTKHTIAQAVSPHSSPREFLRQHADMVDSLVRKAFQKAQTQVSAPSVCLIAVGGYGRAELAPYSDVDLLLLYSSSEKDNLPPLVEKVLYPLWDLGLEVSCSSRSIQECLRSAQSDLYFKTGLIDGRYLDGEYEFFMRLYGLFTKKVLHRSVPEFAKALSEDLKLRNQKYEDPAYALEPNIKEGEGGLRDFQVGRWTIRAKYKTDRWDSILFPDHSRMLEKSLQFLWAVRNQLHLLSGRRQDHLTFELQEKIAPILGLSQGSEGVEEMMRQYHLSTQRISNFVYDILERTVHEPSWVKKSFFFLQRKKIDQNFGMAYGEIHLFDPVTFKRDPSQLMTLFKYCQTYRLRMDFRVEEAVMEALPFVDDRLRTSANVNQTFLSILRKGDEVSAILKKMHELGLLSRFIPEFLEIEGKVHYDLYHVHPVDIHSILAVEELVKLREGLYQRDYSLLTSLARDIRRPEILFLTTLLHDIGKGMHGDHSSNGSEIVQRIGERMGLTVEEREWIGFLVNRHLLMIETAFRRDLHDEQVILHFADQVKSIDQLKMLYLLTFADIKAVGPEAWTSWKGTLLMELFLKASHFFERGAMPSAFLRRDEILQKLHASLPGGIASEFVEHLPDRYLSCYSGNEIAHHIEMAHFIQKELLMVEWEIEKELQAKVTICTKDRYGLFSKITGAMFLNGLNILEAQIHTWGNGTVLDTFCVIDTTGSIDRRLKQFKNDLEEILREKTSLRELLAKRKESAGIKQKIIPRVPQEVRINNVDSDFYTIVEVMGEDRLGILYDITQALTEHGCDIHFARISTLGNRIVDVFYIQDEWGEKVKEINRTDQLKKTVFSRLTPQE